MGSKIFKYLELFIIFITLPLFYHFNLFPGHKSLPLLVVFIYCLIWLLKNKKSLNFQFGLRYFKGWKLMLIRILVSGIVIFIATWLFIPEYLFYLPKNRIGLWVLIMVFYPLWSAYPQELIFRAYFFERYASLFSNTKIIIALNTILFGYMHFIFGNWVAVVGATIIGFIWAFTYSKNKSLLAVAIEHAIVGNLIYTIGLGQYFYVPDF